MIKNTALGPGDTTAPRPMQCSASAPLLHCIRAGQGVGRLTESTAAEQLVSECSSPPSLEEVTTALTDSTDRATQGDPVTGISRVVGVQLATSSVSVAVISRRVNGSCIANTATFTSRLPDDQRAADLAGVIDHVVCAAELAVVGPSTAGPCDDLRRAVLAALQARGVPVSTVSATEPITDIGELWPSVRLASASEATALALAHSGAIHLGWAVAPRTTTPRHDSRGPASRHGEITKPTMERSVISTTESSSALRDSLRP